ncbi:hypothetical protein LCGC14_2839980, partial [marine sediment metagenome]
SMGARPTSQGVRTMESVKTYSVEEVIAAEYTLEPMKCKYCESLEVTFLQYIGDAHCAECGRWQLDGEMG